MTNLAVVCVRYITIYFLYFFTEHIFIELLTCTSHCLITVSQKTLSYFWGVVTFLFVWNNNMCVTLFICFCSWLHWIYWISDIFLLCFQNQHFYLWIPLFLFASVQYDVLKQCYAYYYWTVSVCLYTFWSTAISKYLMDVYHKPSDCHHSY